MSERIVFEEYVGTKFIGLAPMTRGDYNIFRKWKLPAGEDGNDPGYLVMYETDPDNPGNIPGYPGYISWTPKHVAEAAYNPCHAAPISGAMAGLEHGCWVSRECFGKQVYVRFDATKAVYVIGDLEQVKLWHPSPVDLTAKDFRIHAIVSNRSYAEAEAACLGQNAVITRADWKGRYFVMAEDGELVITYIRYDDTETPTVVKDKWVQEYGDTQSCEYIIFQNFEYQHLIRQN